MDLPLKLREPGILPVCSIADLEWVMSNGQAVRVFSADGQRSVEVDSAKLLPAFNTCMVMADALGLDRVALGTLLDQFEQDQQHGSTYARAYVRNRITDAYWLQQLQQVVRLAPDGSGTREALRYLLASVKTQNVLY